VAVSVVGGLLTPALWAQPPQGQLPVGFPGYKGHEAGAPVKKPSAAVPASQVSQLPATPVTVAPVVPPPPPPVPLTPSQKPAKRAQVTYANGILTVVADNSSLNQILRAVMRLTGMQVTGGVTEERVYGTYGPGRVQTVLAQLLDGAKTNVFYLPAMADQPAMLTLTPQGGGSAPPPPSASASDDLLPDGVDTTIVAPQAEPAVVTAAPVPAVVPVNPVAAVPVAPVVAVPAVAAAPAAVVAPDPNAGHHTPEELVQQILQLRAAQQKQQQQQQAAPAAAPTTAPK
jgi:hypothetical protein